jgi:methylthioribose-1-phosphate isomerase
MAPVQNAMTSVSRQQPPRGLWLEEGRVMVLDQTELPHRRVVIELDSLLCTADAIRAMRVRGAPLIGASAAFGLALALRDAAGDRELAAACALLAATRPTAVNLQWAIARVRDRVAPLLPGERARAAWDEALAIARQDELANAAIGEHGVTLIEALHTRLARVINIATHCNAGALATCAGGTALAPVYRAWAEGLPVHVWVSETRPRNQGLLTAWELAATGVPHTLIADNAAGYLMVQGAVDLVIVGADRIAANGDVVNKVGTYLKALAARDNGVPFYVAAPLSTIDWNCASGAAVPIEERSPAEVRSVRGSDSTRTVREVNLAPGPIAAFNPAFDVTAAALVSGIICERGIVEAHALAQLAPS